MQRGTAPEPQFNLSNSKFDFSTLDNRSYTHRVFYKADFCGSNGLFFGEISWTVVEIMAPGRLVARKNKRKTTIQAFAANNQPIQSVLLIEIHTSIKIGVFWTNWVEFRAIGVCFSLASLRRPLWRSYLFKKFYWAG